MGMSAFRIIASTAAAEVFGAPVADPLAGPTALQDLGGRAFVDITAALRSPVGRAVLPRVLDVMEARTAVVLRTLAEDPEFSVQGSRLAFVRKLLRAMARFRMPPVAALALARPAAARRYLARLQQPARDLTPLPSGTPAGQRLDRVEWACPDLPRGARSSGLAAGDALLRARRRWPAARWTRRWRRGAALAAHNVTSQRT